MVVKLIRLIIIANEIYYNYIKYTIYTFTPLYLYICGVQSVYTALHCTPTVQTDRDHTCDIFRSSLSCSQFISTCLVMKVRFSLNILLISSVPQCLYLELEQGLDQTKSLYHKKEFRRAVETLEEVLSTSSNRRLLSEVRPEQRTTRQLNTVRTNIIMPSLFRPICCSPSVTKVWVI